MKKTRRAARSTRKNTRFRSGGPLLRGGESESIDSDDDYDFTVLETMFRAIDQPDGSRHLWRLLAKPLYKMEINNTSQPVLAYGESFWESLLHRAVTQTYDNIRSDEYKADDLKKVSILLDFKGIDVNIQDSNGQTPLMVTRSVECVKLLLAHPGIKVNAVDQEGRTALWHAAALGSKADNDQKRYKRKEYNANDALDISMLLVLAGADEMIADEDGKTVVDVAKDVGLATGSLVYVLSHSTRAKTRANHSANMENFKSFVTEMKYTPVDERNPTKISFFYEDFINLKKIYTKKSLETFFGKKLGASSRSRSRSRGRGPRKTEERKLK